MLLLLLLLLWVPLRQALLAGLRRELCIVWRRSLMLGERIRLIRGFPFERSRHGYLSGWWLRRMPGLLGAVRPLQNVRRGWYSW